MTDVYTRLSEVVEAEVRRTPHGDTPHAALERAAHIALALTDAAGMAVGSLLSLSRMIRSASHADAQEIARQHAERFIEAIADVTKAPLPIKKS